MYAKHDTLNTEGTKGTLKQKNEKKTQKNLKQRSSSIKLCNSLSMLKMTCVSMVNCVNFHSKQISFFSSGNFTTEDSFLKEYEVGKKHRGLLIQFEEEERSLRVQHVSNLGNLLKCIC